MRLKIADDFDLKKIADSGQCFRWSELPSGAYFIPYRDRSLIIKKISDEATGFGTSESYGALYELSCDESEYQNIWSPYLDMDEDYAKIRALVDPKKDAFLHEAATSEQGIRILRQDLWETLISFIISQNRNIPAIKRSIELLCKSCGELMTDAEGSAYYSFPSPEAVAALSPEELDACRLGYRCRYIHETAIGVVDGSISLDGYDALSDDECMERLMSICGVGKKVASCVLLFGLHRIDAFPIDVWIKRILENEYKDGYPMEDYRPYNGVFQQFMFAYYRKKM